MDTEAFRGLLTPLGRDLLAEADGADLTEAGLLATATRLRGRFPADLVNAALTQLRLRDRARAKFGDDASRMFFTPAGLEQSTRAGVASYRARRFADSPEIHRTLEVGCGIGADLLARALAGVPGDGVELDPLTAEVAAANLAAFGVEGTASVRTGDGTAADPSGYGAVFADPGRRTARGRVFDPRAYEPPLDVVLEMARSVPAACVKVAPGIPHEAVPDGAEAEWISVGGDVKEAALWLGGLAGAVRRRATLIPSAQGSSFAHPQVEAGRKAASGPSPAGRPASPGSSHGAGGVVTLTPDDGLGEPEVRGWGRYLYEPDGAVIRAHLVAEVAARVGGGLVDPRIAYITSDGLVATPFAAAYEIEDVLPFSVKRLRAELRRRGAGALTIKKRGFAADVERLRRDLGFGGGRRPARGKNMGKAGNGPVPGASPDPGEVTVVLTRVGDDPVAVLARAERPKPAQ
ncbi:SAM-dependent methyltransferase [Actinomadura logoneensis]|uniref:SAM-dependent methyltransferase n=1 Tax=Actinomadura logoneensis TaxID=2293572 RepID=A0A372JT36_9ACTN|nr:SAM-dependent methyltransferase [Actinomadura logoneensis]RFU43181.1 SAM-dependent methyltransferase [Actinomadura logoneensis]